MKVWQSLNIALSWVCLHMEWIWIVHSSFSMGCHFHWTKSGDSRRFVTRSFYFAVLRLGRPVYSHPATLGMPASLLGSLRLEQRRDTNKQLKFMLKELKCMYDLFHHGQYYKIKVRKKSCLRSRSLSLKCRMALFLRWTHRSRDDINFFVACKPLVKNQLVFFLCDIVKPKFTVVAIFLSRIRFSWQKLWRAMSFPYLFDV